MPNYHHTASGLIAGAYPFSYSSYSTSAATESAAETAWAAGQVAMWTTAGFAGEFMSTVELTQTSTSTMDSTWHQTTKTITTHANSGTATQSLPFHVALVVTWTTSLATRSGRGRWYLPCPASASLATAGYTVSATAQTNFQAGVNAALTAWRGTLTLVILHRKGNKSGSLAPLSTSNIIGGKIGDSYDVQRRRADKRPEVFVSLTV